MKDHKDRLDVIVELSKAAGRHPELRIGQLIVNVLPANLNGDAFYIEDRRLATLLREFS